MARNKRGASGERRGAGSAIFAILLLAIAVFLAGCAVRTGAPAGGQPQQQQQQQADTLSDQELDSIGQDLSSFDPTADASQLDVPDFDGDLTGP